MRSRLVARGRRLRLCACATVIAGLAGCTSAASTSVTVPGRTLTIYASLPAAVAGDQHAVDVLDAEQLALEQNGSRLGSFTIAFKPARRKKVSDNARSAIQDTSAIAYLGEVSPGASADSAGITNDVDLLQVTPADTAVALTQATPAVPGAPSTYYEARKTYGPTFARVVPTTAVEARAMVAEMRSLRVSSLYVAGDQSDYGKAIAQEVRSDAGSTISAASSPAGADAVFYAGSSPAAAAQVLNQAVASRPAAKLFAPSALATQAFVTKLSPAAQRALTVSQPGFYKNLNAAGQKFLSDFQATFGHAPAAEAIFGYEAMAAVLAVLREAGSSAGNRGTVIRDYLAIKNRQSVLGTYSIDSNGDTSLDAFTLSHVEGGRLVPFKALAGQA
jgi:branched-chain amino acid transport system substrate-binding protein